MFMYLMHIATYYLYAFNLQGEHLDVNNCIKEVGAMHPL